MFSILSTHAHCVRRRYAYRDVSSKLLKLYIRNLTEEFEGEYICKLGSIDEALVAPGHIHVAIKRMPEILCMTY